MKNYQTTVSNKITLSSEKRLLALIVISLCVAWALAVFSSPANSYYSNGQTAHDAVGQTLPNGTVDYTSSAVNNPMNVGLSAPGGASIDITNHKAYVADTSNNRLLVYTLNSDNSFPDYAADFVVGQQSFSETSENRGTGTIAANSLSQPTRVKVDQNTGNIYVADKGNNRVLIFSTVVASDPNATYAIGAPDLTSKNAAGTVSASKMLSPSGIAFSGSGGSFKIYISDKDFNRVLVFNPITMSGQNAIFVVGQSAFNTSTPALSQTGLAGPMGIDSTNAGSLYVADTNNNRVMVWTAPIASDGQAANIVLGQTWFYSNSQGVSSTSMSHPQDVALGSGTTTYVADADSNRVLVWNSAVTTSGQAANIVLGQTSFTSNTSGTSSTRLSLPAYVSSAGNVTLISDVQNNRVIGYSSTISSNGQAASFALGQLTTAGVPDFYGNAMNNPQDKGLNGASGVTVDNVHHVAFVADTKNNRVIGFNLAGDNSFLDHYADIVLGQSSFSLTSANRGGSPDNNTMDSPSAVYYDNTNQRLYVADTGNNRVLIYTGGISTNGQVANLVLGQPDFVHGSPAATATGFASPEGISVNTSTNSVAVADRDNNRVLIWTSIPLNNGQAANYVLGQATFTTGNFGTTSTALHTPRGVGFNSNNGYLYVADTDNNRVLVWTASIITNNQAANYVLGQSSFSSSTAQPLSSSSLHQPFRVSVGQTSGVVYVSDTGSNRALVFKQLIVGDNQAADLVIGQPDFSSSGAATSQAGLDVPMGITAEPYSGKVLVADSQNNRVVVYDGTIPSPPNSSTPADGATNVSSTPTFYLTTNDGDGDAIQYKVEVARDAGFTTGLLTYDQTLDPTPWDGQNIGNTYAQGAIGSLTVPTADILSASTQYYWRAYAIDPYGSRTWTAASATKSFTTAPPYEIAVISTVQSVAAGQPSAAIYVVLQDSNGNLVKAGSSVRVYLTTNSGTGNFSLINSPFVNATYVDIAAGAYGATVYYKDPTVGNYMMTFSDSTPANGPTGLVDGNQNISISANVVASYSFSAIGSQVAGVPFAATISALDTYGNVVSIYDGTPNLSATLETPAPSTVTFVAGSWTGQVTLNKAGNQRLSVTNGSATGNSSFFAVAPAPLHHATTTPPTLTAKAGSANNVIARAFDQFDNEISTGLTYAWSADVSAGTVSPTGAATTSLTAANLVGTGDVSVDITEGATTVSAQTAVTIIPDHYGITAIPSPSVAGSNIAATISALTANDIVVANATESVSISDTTATLYPQTVNIASGTWTGNLVITKTATGDIVSMSGHSGAVTGTSNTFNVTPNVLNSITANPTSLTLSVNTTSVVAAEAYDQYDNLITGLTVNWVTTIGSIPATGALVTFNAGSTSGSGTITASITQAATTKTVDIPVTATALSVDHFSFTVIATQTAGQSFPVTIIAKDIFNNTVTNYSGNGGLVFSAGTIIPTSTTDFSGGTWTGSVRVTKAATGTTIVYNDGSHSGTSNTFTVNPDVMSTLDISPSSATLALQSTRAFTVAAADSYGNAITAGVTFAWSINDSSIATISPLSGTSTTLTSTTKAGSTYLNVVATQGSTTLNNSIIVIVSPGALDHFTFDTIDSPQPSNQLLSIKIYARDQFENVVDSFNSSVQLSDLSGSISPNVTTAFSGGTWTGFVQIGTTYTQNEIHAASGISVGSSNKFDVISNLLDHVVITPSSMTVIAGQTQGFSVQGYDAFGNAILGLTYNWSVIGAIGSVSPAAGTATTFTASTATGTGVIQVIGTQGTITKQATAPVTVRSGALDHFFFSPMSDLTAGQTAYVTILAKDAYENTISDFSSSLILSDDLGGIVPTSTGSLTSGGWTGQVQFQKAGITKITATYAAVQSNSDVFTVSPDTLYSADTDQSPFLIIAGKTKLLTGYGRDRFGNEISGVSYTWSLPSAVGSSSVKNAQTMSVTAASRTANATISLMVSNGSVLVNKSIDATVLSDVLARFEIAQVNSPQIAGTPFQITVKATDQYSNTVSDFEQSVKLSDDTGSISPSESNDFTKGVWSGTVTITQTTEKDHIIASSGSVQTQSNEFEVKAGNQQVFLTIVEGSNQTGSAGTRLDKPLTVKAVDLFGNPMSSVSIKYSIDSTPADATSQTLSPPTVTTDGEGIARSSLTLGNRSGSYIISASIEDRSSVSVTFYSIAKASGVASIKVTPGTTTVLIGGSQQFAAQAFDSYGNVLSSETPTWSVIAGGGTINQDGLFVAGTATKVYKDTVTATVNGVSGHATVTVTTLPGLTGDNREGAGIIDRITLVPESPTVQAGTGAAFSVSALDRYNQEVPTSELAFSWKLSGGGVLSNNDAPLTTFTASGEPGSASIEVVVTQASKQVTKSAKTEISITPNPLGYIDVNTPNDRIISGEEFEVTLTAYNGDGTIDTGFAGPIELSDSTATITPRLTGNFTNGIWAGKVAINSSDEATVLKATGNKRQGISNNLKIESKYNFKKATGGILGSAYNVVAGTGEAIANFVHSFLKTSTSYPETTKNITAGGVAAFGFIASALAFGRTATKAIEAIGRNPFARRKILAGLGIAFAVSVIFAGLAFLVASFIKFM